MWNKYTNTDSKRWSLGTCANRSMRISHIINSHSSQIESKKNWTHIFLEYALSLDTAIVLHIIIIYSIHIQTNKQTNACCRRHVDLYGQSSIWSSEYHTDIAWHNNLCSLKWQHKSWFSLTFPFLRAPFSIWAHKTLRRRKPCQAAYQRLNHPRIRCSRSPWNRNSYRCPIRCPLHLASMLMVRLGVRFFHFSFGMILPLVWSLVFYRFLFVEFKLYSQLKTLASVFHCTACYTQIDNSNCRGRLQTNK